nr:MAG: hypothetical protein [Microvirus sp.]
MKRKISMEADNFQHMVNEWSLTNAEKLHVETIEEANDFEIPDDDSEDFLQNITVYEMHEMAEDNLTSLHSLPQSSAPTPEPGQAALTPTETLEIPTTPAPAGPTSVGPEPGSS